MMMTKTLMIVAEMAVINWVLLVAASLIRAKAWTPFGMKVALGNREGVEDPHGFAARTDRSAKNMLENLVLFTAALAAVRLAGKPAPAEAAALFFWARVLYFGVYLAGLRYARTAIWLVSVAAIAWIGAAAF